MKKQKYYIIELGGAKEIYEMKALELNNIKEAIEWIEEAIKSDEDYFNINIKYNIEIIQYKEYETELNFYAKALVFVEYDSIVTYEMIDSEIFDIKDMIESNLNIISKIKLKLIKE